MIDPATRYTIEQTRVRLARSGKHILSYGSYRKLIANGLLEKPYKYPNQAPFHTAAQIERFKLKLALPQENSIKGRRWEENLRRR